MRFPWSFSSPGWTDPALSSLPCMRCSSPLSIWVAPHWTCSISVSLLYWESQQWPQRSRWVWPVQKARITFPHLSHAAQGAVQEHTAATCPPSLLPPACSGAWGYSSLRVLLRIPLLWGFMRFLLAHFSSLVRMTAAWQGPSANPGFVSSSNCCGCTRVPSPRSLMKTLYSAEPRINPGDHQKQQPSRGTSPTPGTQPSVHPFHQLA